MVCAVLAGAGTAALWAVENGVVTSAATNPAQVGSDKERSDADRETTSRKPANDSSTARPDSGARGGNTSSRNARTGPSISRGSAPPVPGSQTSPQPGLRRQPRGNLDRVNSPDGPSSSVATSSTTGDMDIEFWVEWGGGEPRSWYGTLRLDQGEIKTARGYGLQADAPGSAYLEGNVVTISPRLPRSFDSVLVRATAPRDANLLLNFVANGSTADAFEAKLPLRELFNSTQRRALDQRGNKLIVRRTASGALRLETDRASMVFAPNEMFQFSVTPNLPVSRDEQYRCRVQLEDARSSSSLWVDEIDTVFNENGSFSPAGPFKLTMPSDEGVYDLLISVDRRRSSPVSLARRDHWRKLQVVVVNSEQFAAGGESDEQRGQFQVIQAFDPAKPDESLPARKVGPLFGSNEEARKPSSHGEVFSTTRLGRSLLKIGPSSWFALPLQVTQPGRPHMLEIDYPNDALQTLGIAIYEPGNGRAVIDTALTTSAENLAEKSGVTTFRLTFWPSTTTPILVLADRDQERSATIGAIRVAAGPDRLPGFGSRLSSEGRLLAAYLDTPLYPELFSATPAVDPSSRRELRDWVTFFDGTQRLIELLKRRGYNGAVIPVLADGGTLYPSNLLEPTPRFDDGVFFASAQDPMQKDVLEMMLRMFDRAGMRLVPSLRFTGTLPVLEAKRRLGGRPSINLVNTEGKRWRAQPDSFGSGNHYNPLDQDVQAAMRAVVGEVTRRCETHASFAGLAIELDPASYAALPGPDWGADDATLKRFMAAQTTLSSDPPSEQQLRQAWLAWRAERLTEMYDAMRRDLRRNAQGAQLYLLGSSLMNMHSVTNASSVKKAPSGLTAASALLKVGVNVDSLRDKGIVFLSPRQVAPVLGDHVDLNRAWDQEYRRLFGPHAKSSPGTLLQYPLRKFDSAAFSEKLPTIDVARATKTRIVETGSLSRRGVGHSLATLDSQAIFDGAWQTPRDERAWRDTVAAYRQLPRVAFQTVSPPVGSRTQPVVIRRAEYEGKSIFYVVNDSPRPVGSTLR